MSRDRLDTIDWDAAAAALDADGCFLIRDLLTAPECDELTELYVCDDCFRSTISMDRHRYGCGEYRYFKYPLPRLVGRLRQGLYGGLVACANDWAARLRRGASYPAALDDYLATCHAAGQTRPTPLLLRYEEGGYNRLHQDLYGPHAFPFQVVVALSELHRDYEGGEIVFVEQPPRMQGRATILKPRRGDAIVFPNAERPVRGTRGDMRVKIRHGISTVTRGRRYALGLIFHDAE